MNFMAGKVIAGMLIMLMVTLSAFAFSSAQLNGKVNYDSVEVDGIATNKIVYGSTDVSSDALIRYKNHCSSVGGRFNECGSYCKGDEVCATVCVYTCEDIAVRKDGIIGVDTEESKVRVDYRTDESGYTITYEDGYKIETDIRTVTASNGVVKVEVSDGSEATIRVNPDQAITKAFNSELENVDVKLEEKNYNNVPAVVYKLEGEHQGRFLGLFNIKTRYQAAVDASNGDVLEWNGPWWAFMITSDGSSTEPTRPAYVGSVTDYESCVVAGNPVMESYPRQCKHGNVVYTEEIISDAEIPDIISSEGIQGEAGYGGGGGRPVDNDVYSSRDVTLEECSKIDGIIKTKCVGGDGPCMRYCDFSSFSNAKEKCDSLNGKLSQDGIICTIYFRSNQAVIDFESCVEAGNSVVDTDSNFRECVYGDVTFAKVV